MGFKQFLRIFDIFADTPNLMMKKKEKLKTSCGGCLSMFYSLMILYFFISDYFFNYHKIFEIEKEEFIDSHQNFELTGMPFIVDLFKNSLDFPFEKIKSKINLSFLNKIEYNDQGIKIIKNLNLEFKMCSEVYNRSLLNETHPIFNKIDENGFSRDKNFIPFNKKLYEQKWKKNQICIDPLEFKSLTNERGLIQFKISLCKNDTISSNCDSEEQIIKSLNGLRIKIKFINYREMDQKYDFPGIFYMNEKEFDLSPLDKIVSDIIFQGINFFTKINKIFIFHQIKNNILRVIKMREKKKKINIYSKEIFELNMKIDNFTNEIKRHEINCWYLFVPYILMCYFSFDSLKFINSFNSKIIYLTNLIEYLDLLKNMKYNNEDIIPNFNRDIFGNDKKELKKTKITNKTKNTARDTKTFQFEESKKEFEKIEKKNLIILKNVENPINENCSKYNLVELENENSIKINKKQNQKLDDSPVNEKRKKHGSSYFEYKDRENLFPSNVKKEENRKKNFSQFNFCKEKISNDNNNLNNENDFTNNKNVNNNNKSNNNMSNNIEKKSVISEKINKIKEKNKNNNENNFKSDKKEDKKKIEKIELSNFKYFFNKCFLFKKKDNPYVIIDNYIRKKISIEEIVKKLYDVDKLKFVLLDEHFYYIYNRIPNRNYFKIFNEEDKNSNENSDQNKEIKILDLWKNYEFFNPQIEETKKGLFEFVLDMQNSKKAKKLMELIKS